MKKRGICALICALMTVTMVRPARAVSVFRMIGEALTEAAQRIGGTARMSDAEELYFWMYADEERVRAEDVDAQAALLIAQGITGLTEEKTRSAREFAASMGEYGGLTRAQSMLSLLFSAGMGQYDDAWSWSPSSDTVYSFDAEVFDIGNMYGTFLTGISAIGQGKLAFTDVTEDMRDVNEEEGTGVRHVSFRLNGTAYTYDAREMQDWFDVGMLDFMNKALEAEGMPERLHFTSDGTQGVIVLFGTPQWARDFMEATGVKLFTGF